MDKLNITFLGTGTSTGIPIVGCPCHICHSSNEKDKRLRTSIFVEYKGYHFIIDTGPDLRTQLLRSNINKCDFAIITHGHSDHLNGIDDLRPFTFFPKRQTLPVFAHPIHKDTITNRFDYIFKRDEIFNAKNPYLGGGLPLLNLHPIDELNSKFSKLNMDYVMLPHGNGETMGLIIDNKLGYLIDCHEIPAKALQKIKSLNLECVIIDCLQKEDHPSHLTLKQSFDYLSIIRPKKGILIHMNHDLGHEELENLAKDHFDFPVAPAFDQMRICI